MHLLLIEDDIELADALAEQFRSHGYALDHYSEGTAGLWAALHGEFTAMIVDRMLPGMDELTLVKRLREECDTPIMFLTTMDGSDDRVQGLEAGDIEMDLVTRCVSREGRLMELRAQEFRLLGYMMRNVDRVVTRRMLLENVWDLHVDPHTSVVESHVSRLRACLNEGFAVDAIATVRGVGYRLNASR